MPITGIDNIARLSAAAAQATAAAAQATANAALPLAHSINSSSSSDVTLSRAGNSIYTNTSNKPKKFSGYFTNISGGSLAVVVNGAVGFFFSPASGVPQMPFVGVALPGETYEVQTTGSVTLTKWEESI